MIFSQWLVRLLLQDRDADTLGARGFLTVILHTSHVSYKSSRQASVLRENLWYPGYDAKCRTIQIYDC